MVDHQSTLYESNYVSLTDIQLYEEMKKNISLFLKVTQKSDTVSHTDTFNIIVVKSL